MIPFLLSPSPKFNQIKFLCSDVHGWRSWTCEFFSPDHPIKTLSWTANIVKVCQSIMSFLFILWWTNLDACCKYLKLSEARGVSIIYFKISPEMFTNSMLSSEDGIEIIMPNERRNNKTKHFMDFSFNFTTQFLILSH